MSKPGKTTNPIAVAHVLKYFRMPRHEGAVRIVGVRFKHGIGQVMLSYDEIDNLEAEGPSALFSRVCELVDEAEKRAR